MADVALTRHVSSDTPRVMVVDGSKVVRRLIEQLLKADLPGVTVLACESGAEAKKQLEAGVVLDFPVKTFLPQLISPCADPLRRRLNRTQIDVGSNKAATELHRNRLSGARAHEAVKNEIATCARCLDDSLYQRFGFLCWIICLFIPTLNYINICPNIS